MQKKGVFASNVAVELVDACEGGGRQQDRTEKALEDLGIQSAGTAKFALVYEAYLDLDLGGDDPEPARVWYRHDGSVLSCMENPLWCKRLPLLAAAVDKLNGVARGSSPVKAVRTLQWQANDMQNIGQDAAMYATLPIIMTDPEKNPQYQSLVLSMAAIWPVDPKSTQTLTFPTIYQHAFAIVEGLKAQVRESMQVNEYQLGQMPQGRKTNAQTGAIGQEAAVTVNDVASSVEEEIMDPLMELFFELDQQYREDDLVIKVMGEIGIAAKMERVPPAAFYERYWFSWIGTDFVASMQRIQSQIAAMNVLRGIPPQAMMGKRIDISPIVEDVVRTVFGERLSPQIIVDQRDQISIDVELENEMLHNGLMVMVRPMDNDLEHLQSHNAVAKQTEDPTGAIRAHMMEHMRQMQAKAVAAGPQQPQPGEPGIPGGAAPGVPGTPRVGAVPGNVRPLQRPPGAIHQDAIASPDVASRG
jgi:hypothetical protein